MPRVRRTSLASVGVAVFAFLLYHATLLPGLDFGDTPSFQVMGGEAAITPRDGYPLYFAVGSPFVWLAGDRAHGLNLASAAEAAFASGLVVAVASELAGSLLPGIAAGLLFTGSYTFWSQAVITEVYALHMLFVALTLWLLLRWERAPSRANLAWFFAAYAIGFGNHLSMILLAPAYTLFLLASAPRGWRSMFAPPVVALALGLAAAGALQYAWNLRSLWLAPVPPPTFADGMRTFWFDVTKSDWRETMMANVPRVMLPERLRMYWFDLGQQFGVAGPILAAIGIVWLFRSAPRRGWLLLTLFAANVLFALSYNVGDSHVFFLPSHLMVALVAAPGLAMLDAALPLRFGAVSALAVVLAAGRIHRDYPALDRSADERPTDTVSAITAGLDDEHALLVTDLNWQVQNGLTYFAKEIRPDLAFTRMPEVLLYAPALFRDNMTIGRDVVLTDRARSELGAAYGSLFTVVRDDRVRVQSLADLTQGLARGTRYVLSVLKPTSDFSIDRDDLQKALAVLVHGAEGRATGIGEEDYGVVAGVVGEPPSLVMSSHRPFRVTASVGAVNVDVRMESWLAFDTIRRMGFGHVIAKRRHTLIIERGISFVAFDAEGRPLSRGYSAGLFAPQPRYLVKAMAIP